MKNELSRNLAIASDADGRSAVWLSPASFGYPEYFDSSSWIDHAPFAFWLTDILRPRLVVELGTHGGFSYFVFCQAVKTLALDTRCCAVDHWKGDAHAGFYGDEVYRRVNAHNEKHYASFSRLMRSTFDEAIDRFADGSIDLLHIDGRHFYEDVKHDYESWRPKLSDRAVVLFHDVAARERDFGVHRLFRELAGVHPAFAFEHGDGLGVLGYGSHLPDAMESFFAATADPAVARAVRQAYGRLGGALRADFESRATLSKLTAKLSQQEMRAGEYRARLEGREADVKHLRARLQALRAHAAALESNLAAHERTANELRRSLSWRITAPVRFAHNVLIVGRWLCTGQIDRAVRASARHFGPRTPAWIARGMPGRLMRRLLKNRPAPPAEGGHAAVERYRAITDSIRFPEVDEPEVSVIIPVYNEIGHTLSCLRSLAGQASPYPFEVIIMDDGSSDATPDVLSGLPGIRYHRNPGNLGFNRACNLGAERARGRYLVFLNNDTEVHPGWLQALRDTFDRHDHVGVVGSKLIYPDGRLQEAGGIIWSDGSGANWGRLEDPNHPRYNFVRDVDYVSGSSLMIPRALFFDLGGFADALEDAYYEDTWLAFAAREAGYRVLYQPRSALVHVEGATAGRDVTAGRKRYQLVNQQKFVERWSEALRAHLPAGLNPERACDRTPRSHILVIEANTPTPDQDAGSVAIFNLIKLLCRFGYRVHYLPFDSMSADGSYTQDLQELGVECVYRPYYEDARQYLVECGDMFSHVIISRAPVAVEIIDDVEACAPRAGRIFYTVDLHGLREIREAELHGDAQKRAVAEETLRREMALIRRSDVAVVLSRYEAEWLREDGHDNVEVLPLITDHPAPDRPPDFEARRDVVFIGGYQHQPNIDAVRWLVEEIWPQIRVIMADRGLPGLRLQVIGSRMPEWFQVWARADIQIIGHVEQLSERLSGIRLSLAPLRYGAGLKGKIITSLGCGVPAVGTSIAFEGMPEEGLSDIRLCADDPVAFARLVVDTYQDASRWRRVSSAGIAYVQRHFSMQAVESQVRRILERAAPRREAETPVPRRLTP